MVIELGKIKSKRRVVKNGIMSLSKNPYALAYVHRNLGWIKSNFCFLISKIDETLVSFFKIYFLKFGKKNSTKL